MGHHSGARCTVWRDNIEAIIYINKDPKHHKNLYPRTNCQAVSELLHGEGIQFAFES